jgi:chorismate synthase
MNGNTFGTIFRVTTWGESHGAAIGAIIDGCPSGISLSVEDFQEDLQMRQGGNQSFTTPRKESDQVFLESGVFEGITTGTPIALRIENKNQKSEDYDALKTVFRPGHADLTTHVKHQHRDPRGGGRASARETAARVAAGVVAKKILSRFGVEIAAWVQQVGPHTLEFDFEEKTISQLKQFRSYSRLLTLEVRPEIEQQLETLKQVGDSWGGAITCAITGLAPGLGEPNFDKMQSLLAHGILSLPAAVGFEIGSGRGFSQLPGSAIRDEIIQTSSGPRPKTNKTGGLLGGLTTGNPLYFSTYFHAPTSIPRNISSVNERGETVEVNVQGRHDCFPLPRAIPMVESMAAITLVDAYMRAGRIPEKL